MGRLTYAFSGNTGGGGTERLAEMYVYLQSGGSQNPKLRIDSSGNVVMGGNVTMGALPQSLTLDGAITLGSETFTDTVGTISRASGVIGSATFKGNRDGTTAGWIDLSTNQAFNNMKADGALFTPAGADNRIAVGASPYNITDNETYVGVNANSGAVTVNIPIGHLNGAWVGRTIIIKDEKRNGQNGASTNAITVGFHSGSNGWIDDRAVNTGITINQDNDSVTLMCVASDADESRWVITNSHN